MVQTCSRKLGVEKVLNDLTLGMFRPSADKKPSFKHKAAEGRYLLPVLREMMFTYFDTTTPHATLRLQACDALMDLYKQLENWTPTSAATLANRGRQFLILCVELRNEATSLGRDMLWGLYPKHHLMMHVCEAPQSTLINPKAEWNYLDEDEIGKAARACAKISKAHLPYKALDRYRLVFRELYGLED